MDELKRAAIRDLAPGNVRYLPASFDKRFGRSLAERAEAEDFEPSSGQWMQIQRIVHRYRRQIPRAHRALCEGCGPEQTLALFS